MKYTTLLLVSFLLLTIIVTTASAGEYMIPLDSDDNAHVNQTYIQDPTHGDAMPFPVWIGSGITGLILVLLALLKPRTEKMDYESSIIISVMSWPFCWAFAWGCLTSVDYIVGVGLTSTASSPPETEVVMITQHILYSFWQLGIVAAAGGIFAIVITILLITQFDLFKSKTPKDKILPETK